MDPRTVMLGKESMVDAYAASGCSTMADFLSSPTFLERIKRMGVFYVLLSVSTTDHSDLSSIESGEALRFCTDRLRMHEEEREAGSFLRFLRALPCTACPSLQFLKCIAGVFESLEELAAFFAGIASPTCSFSTLSLIFPCQYIRRESRQSDDDGHVATQESIVGDALSNNTSLRSLYLNVKQNLQPNDDQRALYSALLTRSASKCPITDLLLVTHFPLTFILSMNCELQNILLGVANNTIALARLVIAEFSLVRSVDFEPSLWQVVGTILETSTSLECLELVSIDSWPGEVVETLLLRSLRKNTHLRRLSLARSTGPGWPSARLVLDSLRAHGLLSELDLEGSPLEKGSSRNELAAIKAQLKRNKKNLEEIDLFQSHALSQIEPSNVRLFLCGLPFSGKTTLSRSLVGRGSPSSKSTFSFITSCLTKKSSSIRTRGIEISTLQHGKVKVSLWDMAGQHHYYAFHDCMFPNLNINSTPSLLLFVWSPIQLDTLTGKEVKDFNEKVMRKTEKMFNEEFRYWLSFIASKTLKSLSFRPRLLVAFTRADQSDDVSIKEWLKDSFTQCKKDFEEYIQFDMEGVFEMDAREPHEVEALTRAIFDRAALMLDPMPKVYGVCEQARNKFASLLNSGSIAPLMTKVEFSELCKRYLPIDTKEVEEAIAHSLNDSGDLIYFKSLEIVVVDTQWFCNHIMGNLLHFAADDNYHDKGFFDIMFLESLLEKHLNSRISSNHSNSCWFGCTKAGTQYFPKIDGKALVKLLIGLKLACQYDDDSKIFIPASLCTPSTPQIRPSLFLKHGESFMGSRFKCKNSICTFFTPGIFPFLQVTLNVVFGAETTLQQGVVALNRDGNNVLIEFCKLEGKGHFIDILVRSGLDLEETIEWVYGEIIDRVEKACAEPRGIQGVELEEEVIRPGCVCKEERNETVSMEKLRNTLSDHLDKKWPQLPQLDRLRSVVLHSWPSGDADPVVDLLGRRETLKVFTTYKRKFISDVEDVLGVNMEKEAAGCSPTGLIGKHRVFSSTVSGKEREMLHEDLQDIRKDLQDIRKDLQEIHKDIQKIGQDMQKLFESSLPALKQRMEELFVYFKERDMASLPRMSVVTINDGGRMRKIVGAFIPSLRNVRLQLLCEYSSQPHLVPEQLGLDFETMDDGLLKDGLPYINKFLRLATVVMKVGASVALGLGPVIPDFSCVLDAMAQLPSNPPPTPQSSTQMSRSSLYLITIIDATHSSDDVDTASNNLQCRLDVQNGQRWLHTVLSTLNCHSPEKIHEKFGLNRVLYGGSHVGWLCDSHSVEGDICCS